MRQATAVGYTPCQTTAEELISCLRCIVLLLFIDLTFNVATRSVDCTTVDSATATATAAATAAAAATTTYQVYNN